VSSSSSSSSSSYNGADSISSNIALPRVCVCRPTGATEQQHTDVCNYRPIRDRVSSSQTNLALLSDLITRRYCRSSSAAAGYKLETCVCTEMEIPWEGVALLAAS